MEEKAQSVPVEEKKPPENKCFAKRVIFDVVSSVKGGSGKSTFSFLLAAYYNSVPGATAYVLDLDLRGTSWEKNYGRYMTTEFFEEGNSTAAGSEKIYLSEYYKAQFEDLMDSSVKEAITYNEDILKKRKRYREYPFINSMMWSFTDFNSRPFWSEIAYRPTSQNDTARTIKICPARAAKGTEVDQIEVEIFEHTVYQIILEIMNRHREDQELSEVHIIMDMPPSYEKHAEAVLKHLLVNEDSELFQHAKSKINEFAVNPNDKTRYYRPYEVRLFMLCARNPAHIEQNGIYMRQWVEKRRFSDALSEMIKDNEAQIKIEAENNLSVTSEKVGRFLVCFVVNDVSGNYWLSKEGRRDTSKSEFEQYAKWAEEYFNNKGKEASSPYAQVKQYFNRYSPNLIHCCAFPHVNLSATYWEMEAEPAPSSIVIDIEKENINPLDYINNILDML